MENETKEVTERTSDTTLFDVDDDREMPVQEGLSLFNGKDLEKEIVKDSDMPAEMSGGEDQPNEDNFLEIVYRGEKQILNRTEAVELAQKGRDYDTVRSERDRLRTEIGTRDGYKDIVDYLARENGAETEEFLTWVKGEMKKTAYTRAYESLKNTHPDTPDELIRELAKSRAQKAEKELMDSETNKTQKDIDALMEEYPETKSINDLPESVRAAISTGEKPVEAMRKHEIKELKQRIAQLETAEQNRKQNETNRTKSIGSVKSNGEPMERDVFLSALGYYK